jgi:hypothetical protein
MSMSLLMVVLWIVGLRRVVLGGEPKPDRQRSE